MMPLNAKYALINFCQRKFGRSVSLLSQNWIRLHILVCFLPFAVSVLFDFTAITRTVDCPTTSWYFCVFVLFGDTQMPANVAFALRLSYTQIRPSSTPCLFCMFLIFESGRCVRAACRSTLRLFFCYSCTKFDSSKFRLLPCETLHPFAWSLFWPKCALSLAPSDQFLANF